MLDLCPEYGCAEAYWRFEHKYRQETKRHAEEFRVHVQGMMEKFWEELERGSPETTETINAASSGKEVGPL